MMERVTISGAPESQEPNSPAAEAVDFLYVSGQGPVDAVANEFVFGLENIRRILNGCGALLRVVVLGARKPGCTMVQAMLMRQAAAEDRNP
jgi:enamine deaminase RidA (YjgF/YER057c/UK114 family)